MVYVAIYDYKKLIPPEGRFYFLAPCDRFDPFERQAMRPSRSMVPLERLKEGKWSQVKKW
jgi:hypothetical protein